MPRHRKLTVATCQFPVSSDVRRNLKHVLGQMKTAASKGADVAHFSETCLSGYAGADFDSFKKFDWDLHERCLRDVIALARRLGLWVVIGSSHPLSGAHKPHNSLYIINGQGRIVDRYDKLFCTGNPAQSSDDLKHYSPGNHFSVFTINGVRCGALICHDYRYQELYRVYKQQDVQVMFHSYHNRYSLLKSFGRQLKVPVIFGPRGSARRNGAAGRNLWSIVVPATMQTYAGNNAIWISANNTGDRKSCWPSFFVRPDGIVSGQLANGRAGILISEVDPSARFYDASACWRERAMNGIYHSGTLVRDRRSGARTSL